MANSSSSSGTPEAQGTPLDPSVSFINDQVISSKVSQEVAVGKAYQAVSQSMSLAVQDASDNLRNFMTVNLAALSYAQEQLLISENVAIWTPVIESLQGALTEQMTCFTDLGTDAAQILQKFTAIKASSTSSDSGNAAGVQGNTQSSPSEAPTVNSNSSTES
jgi:hypothetical protein